MSPQNGSEKILSTKLSHHNDHHIADSTISISDTRIDHDVLSYKHHLVYTDYSHILDSVVPDDEVLFCNISSGIVDNNYSTTKVNGKVYFSQHYFYNNDSATIDSSAVHFFQNLKEHFIYSPNFIMGNIEPRNYNIFLFFSEIIRDEAIAAIKSDTNYIFASFSRT